MTSLTSQRPSSRTSRGRRALPFLAVLGPGLLAGLSDDDPAGITTYSVLGADHGYRLLWVLLLSTVALMVFHDLGARLGVVTGQGLIGLIRHRYGVGVGAGAAGRPRPGQPGNGHRGVRRHRCRRRAAGSEPLSRRARERRGRVFAGSGRQLPPGRARAHGAGRRVRGLRRRRGAGPSGLVGSAVRPGDATHVLRTRRRRRSSPPRWARRWPRGDSASSSPTPSTRSSRSTT